MDIFTENDVQKWRIHLHLHPLEFENDDIICCFQAKCPKIFARASDAKVLLVSSSFIFSVNMPESTPRLPGTKKDPTGDLTFNGSYLKSDDPRLRGKDGRISFFKFMVNTQTFRGCVNVRDFSI